MERIKHVQRRLNTLDENGFNDYHRTIQIAKETNVRNGYWLCDSQKEPYEVYKGEVWSYTRNQDLESLPNYELRGHIEVEGAYHLDHKFSIRKGFDHGILQSIIGNIKNLEFIPQLENVAKGQRCSITLEELLNELEEQ